MFEREEDYYMQCLMKRFNDLGYTRSPLSFRQIRAAYYSGLDLDQAVSIGHDITMGLPAAYAFERNR